MIYFKIVIYSEQVHTPAPDFFELKPVLRPGQVQAVDESRSERSQLPTLWRKDVPGDGAYYKNKPFHQGTYSSIAYFITILLFPHVELLRCHFKYQFEKERDGETIDLFRNLAFRCPRRAKTVRRISSISQERLHVSFCVVRLPPTRMGRARRPGRI